MIEKLVFVAILFHCCISLVVYPEVDRNVVLNNPYMGYQISTDIESKYGYNHSTIYLRASGNCRVNGKFISMSGLNWDTLNPSRGNFDFSSIDKLISCCEYNKKFGHVRMRNVVSPGDMPNIPSYLENTILESNGLENSGGKYKGHEVHYYTCSFLKYWGELVEALRIKIKDVPWINMVDIGSVGWYGEWDTVKLIKDTSAGYVDYDPYKANIRVSMSTILRILRMFTGGSGVSRCIDSQGNEVEEEYSYPGFGEKYIFMNQGNSLSVRMGLENGCGWRNDIVGYFEKDDWAKQWREFIFPLLKENWKKFPNAGEFPKELNITRNYKQLVCQSKAYHIAAVHDNHQNKPEPEELFQEYFRLIGYRLYLEKAEYPNIIDLKNGPKISVICKLTFRNNGTSPAYKKYPLFLYIKKKGIETPLFCQNYTNEEIDIRKILPNEVTNLSSNFTICDTEKASSVTFSVSFTVPGTLKNGIDYELYFSFVEDVRKKPIEFAMKKKDSFGRYYIGRVEITNSQGTGNLSQICNESIVPFVSIQQFSERPKNSLNKANFSRVFEPSKNHYIYRWGDSDKPERLYIRYDSRETYIQFDLTNEEVLNSKNDIVGATLSLTSWSRNLFRHVFQADVIFEDWSVSSFPEWDDRPRVVSKNRIFVGNFSFDDTKLVTLEIPKSILVGKLIGKVFTVVLYSLKPSNPETSATIASKERNKGQFAPYLQIFGLKENDDVVEYSGSRVCHLAFFCVVVVCLSIL